MVFYPGDDTPGCTKQLEEFEAFSDRLNDLGCKIYAVNPADAASHRAFAEKYNFSFPVLVDRGTCRVPTLPSHHPFSGCLQSHPNRLPHQSGKEDSPGQPWSPSVRSHREKH